MKIINKVKYLILSIILILILASCNKFEYSDIVSTNYVGYDFSRSITDGSSLKVSMLLKPGSEIHGYDPSPKDIINIVNSKLFIYVGGESDSEWVEKSILPQINKEKTLVLSMFDVLEENGVLYHEEEFESNHESDEDEEYDEHVWNDLDNAKIIYNAIKEKIKLFNNEVNETKTNEFINNIDEIKNKFNELLKNNNKIMIFADRFPLLYFTNEFNIKYDAALSGCSTASEAAQETLKRLKKTIMDNNIKYIFTIELSNKKIANSLKNEIANEIKNGKYNGSEIEILTFYSMHNISKEDFEKNITFIDFLNMNYETLSLYLK